MPRRGRAGGRNAGRGGRATPMRVRSESTPESRESNPPSYSTKRSRVARSGRDRRPRRSRRGNSSRGSGRNNTEAVASTSAAGSSRGLVAGGTGSHSGARPVRANATYSSGSNSESEEDIAEQMSAMLGIFGSSESTTSTPVDSTPVDSDDQAAVMEIMDGNDTYNNPSNEAAGSESSFATSSDVQNVTRDSPGSLMIDDFSDFSVEDEPANAQDYGPDFEIPGPSSDIKRSPSKKEGAAASCTICMEEYVNYGDHTICSLKCGHVFGLVCIDRWLRNRDRCPTCNKKSYRNELRPIFATNLIAQDVSELRKCEEALRDAHGKINSYKMTVTKLQTMNDQLSQEINKLSNGQLREGGINPVPVQQNQGLVGSLMKVTTLSSDGEGRVGIFSEGLNAVVISHKFKSPSFPRGYGIKKIGIFNLNMAQNIPLHSKQLRDMCFASSRNDQLLSVGLDMNIVLTDLRCNVSILRSKTPRPIWSCAWDPMDEHVYYIGLNSGYLNSFDVRMHVQPFETVKVDDSLPISRIIPVKFKNFPGGGLFLQNYRQVVLAEKSSSAGLNSKLHALVDNAGAINNIEYEANTDTLVASLKPKRDGRNLCASKHVVYDFTPYKENENGEINYRCFNERVITGSSFDGSILTRSGIFLLDDELLFACNGERRGQVDIWNAKQSIKKTELFFSSTSVDLLCINAENSNFLVSVHDKEVSFTTLSHHPGQ